MTALHVGILLSLEFASAAAMPDEPPDGILLSSQARYLARAPLEHDANPSPPRKTALHCLGHESRDVLRHVVSQDFRRSWRRTSGLSVT
jgi:hypothetical protein